MCRFCSVVENKLLLIVGSCRRLSLFWLGCLGDAWVILGVSVSVLSCRCLPVVCWSLPLVCAPAPGTHPLGYVNQSPVDRLCRRLAGEEWPLVLECVAPGCLLEGAYRPGDLLPSLRLSFQYATQGGILLDGGMIHKCTGNLARR